MNEKKIVRWLNVVWVILFAVWLVVVGLYFGGILSTPFNIAFSILQGLFLCMLIIGLLINNLKGRINAKTRLVKFFCPKCEEYVSSPRNRPNCPNCNAVMYPMRYCPKCRIDDTVVSLNQWRCYRCGSKLKEIINIVSTDQMLDKEAV